MNKFIKMLVLGVLTACCGSLFAYNGGYENSINWRTSPSVGYGDYELTATPTLSGAIAANAYAQCKKLKSVNLTGVTSIGDAAFAYSALESVTIPATVSSIGYIAFGGCTNLTSVTIKGWSWLTGDSSVTIKEPFCASSKLKSITVPGGVPSRNLKTIFPAITTVRCPSANIAAWKSIYPDLSIVDASNVRVNFNGNGADTLNSNYKTVTVGSTYGTLATAAKKGYSLAGWFTKAVEGSLVTASTKVTSTSEHTLYAHWNPAKYKVTFDGNGATSQNSTGKTVVFAAQYGTLATAKRTGYGFAGWYTGKSGGSLIKSTTYVSTPCNHTLYARWVAPGDKVRVVFNGNGATYQNASYKNAGYLDTYGTLATVSRTGYIFLGWFTEKNGGTQVTSKSTMSSPTEQILYAHWIAEGTKLRVNFDGNGADSLNSDHKTVTFYEKYGVLAKATRDDYIFIGWFTEKVGGEQLTSASKVKIPNNHTLYAHWIAEGTKFRVNFDGNGADSLNSDHKTVTFYEKYGVLAKASRSNYSFDGWFTLETGGERVTSATKVKTAMNHTLYAHWTPVPSNNAAKLGNCLQSSASMRFFSGVLPDQDGTYYLNIDEDLNVDRTVKGYFYCESVSATWSGAVNVLKTDNGIIVYSEEYEVLYLLPLL